MSAETSATMLAPLVAMVAVTFVVWLRMYQLRLGEMRRERIHPQRVALSGPKRDLLHDTRASDNFANLFELPVLFYAGVLAAALVDAQDGVLLALAWAFVALRAVHSLIQCSYNRVMHRFTIYVLGGIALFAFWIRLGWILAG